MQHQTFNYDKEKGIRIDSNTRRDLFDKFADYALDLSKLVFGGVILAGIMGLIYFLSFFTVLAAIALVWALLQLWHTSEQNIESGI